MKCIIATDMYNGIGKNNTLPWKNTNDLKRFRELTENSTMLMGAKTFFSLPINKRPLPGEHRKSIVLTFDPYAHKFENYKSCKNLQIMTIDQFNETYTKDEQNEMMLIGGSQMFNLFFEDIHTLYLTVILGNYHCDTFVKMNVEDWKIYKHEKYEDSEYFILKK
jgi:dihydrofolate reductase